MGCTLSNFLGLFFYPFGVVQFMRYYTSCLCCVQSGYYSLRNAKLCAFAMSSWITTVYEIKYFVSLPYPAGLLKSFLGLSRTQPKVGLECPKAVNASKKISLSFVPYSLLHSFFKLKGHLTTQRHLMTGKV